MFLKVSSGVWVVLDQSAGGRAGWQDEFTTDRYNLIINEDDVLDGVRLETAFISPSKIQLGSDRHDAQRSVAKQGFRLPYRVNRASQPVWIVKSYRA